MVNVSVLVVVAAGVGLISVPVGMTVAGLGGLVVWFRGYLLPFTPRFAPALADLLPWNLFHHEPPSESLARRDDNDGQVVLDELIEAGVIRTNEETLELDDHFESEWYDEMERLGSVTDETLAKELASRIFDDHDVSVHSKTDPPYLVVSDRSGSIEGETWIRRPIATVETAAAFTLQRWNVRPDLITPAAHSLGLFLSTCPRCGTELSEQPVSGCCGPPETGPEGNIVGEIVCESCTVRFHISEQIT